ncbi:MAG: RNA-binding S4 domain-containing protein [Propionibacteriaceae bacterium]|nr:RNA-binding S4 domain-containing protein [Propionibacteriaceae bacterium]
MARLDVWLWSVRLFKTRSMATNAVRGGHVRLNGDPVKPAREVKPGDRVTVKEPGWVREFEVVQLLKKRVGHPVAITAYIDHSPERPPQLTVAMGRRDRGAGRPTKRDRRDIDKLIGRYESESHADDED